MKKYKFLKIILTLTLVTILVTACSSTKTQNTSDDGSKIKIVTSIYPMQDFAKKISKDKAQIENLVPAGVEPHGWEPGAGDIKKLEKADIFIYNGAGFEGWVDKVVSSLSNKNLIVVDASKNIDLLANEDNDPDEEHGKYDPHVWLSLKNAQKQMENIKQALIEKDSKNKEYYQDNFEKAVKEFQSLDEEYEKALKPFKGKDIITAHEAFAYLCRDYGLKQVGIEGVFEDSEPDPSKMKGIIDFVKKNNIKVIFTETLASPKVSETIANETGAKTLVLNPIEGLTKQEESEGKDYLLIMKENLNNLLQAF